MRPAFWSAAAWCLVLPALGGCGWVQRDLGMREGYLLQTRDVLALPGEKVQLWVRLQSGGLLREQSRRPVRFLRDGRLETSAVTDDEGIARVAFLPPSAGDYLLTVEVGERRGKKGEGLPPPGEILVACRDPEAPIAVVDIDRTLVDSDFQEVFTGDPPPLPRAADVMRRLAVRHSIVYLTHRSEYLGPKTKEWLARRGFPRGPVLLADFAGLLKGNEKDKADRLRVLRTRFHALQIGIGDKASDARAYRENGLRTFLLYRLEDPDDSRKIRRQARMFAELPEGVQVIAGWEEIESALYEGKTFPASAAGERLGRLADDLEAGRKSP